MQREIRLKNDTEVEKKLFGTTIFVCYKTEAVYLFEP